MDLRGFSLIELLVVLAILGILAVAAIPAVTSVAVGSNLSRAGDAVKDRIAFARQEALTKNRVVQVWFFQQDRVCGVTVARVEDGANGQVTNIVVRPYWLPDGIIFSTNVAYSSLLDAGGLRGKVVIPGSGEVGYRGFRILADGSLDASVETNDFLTLQGANDKESPPRNYYTLQINPFTAKISVFRP